MNHYFTSAGERVSKGTIDRNVRKAKDLKKTQFYNEHGYYFCEDCGVNESGAFKIDCSHDVSVNDCQNYGVPEYAWNINNIKLRCRKCHNKHDNN